MFLVELPVVHIELLSILDTIVSSDCLYLLFVSFNVESVRGRPIVFVGIMPSRLCAVREGCLLVTKQG